MHMNILNITNKFNLLITLLFLVKLCKFLLILFGKIMKALATNPKSVATNIKEKISSLDVFVKG